MLANSPCTSTTARGGALVGWHDQLFAPGGGDPCWVAPAITLAEKKYGTGYCCAAWATAGTTVTPRVAAARSATNLVMDTRRTADPPPVRPTRPVGRYYPAVAGRMRRRRASSAFALLRREDRAVRARRRHQARPRIVARPARGLAPDQLLAVRRPPDEIGVRERVGGRVRLEQQRSGPVGAVGRRAVH